MATLTVTYDDRRARAMLRSVGTAALRLQPTLEIQADKAARSITGIPRDSGKLAEAIREGGEATDSGFEVDYYERAFYGRFILKDRPPTIPRSIGSDTAVAIKRRLMGVSW